MNILTSTDNNSIVSNFLRNNMGEYLRASNAGESIAEFICGMAYKKGSKKIGLNQEEGYSPYTIILNTKGETVYYHPTLPYSAAPDFKIQPNGMITYYRNNKWMIVCNHQQVINLLQNHIWHYHNQGYAGTNIGGKIKLFHQMYIRYGQGLVIDHINHLKTDNRFDNLKVCTYKQNSRNLKKRAETLTTGVCVQMCGTINYVVSFINDNQKQKQTNSK